MKIEIEDELLEQLKEGSEDLFDGGYGDQNVFEGYINQLIRNYLKEGK